MIENTLKKVIIEEVLIIINLTIIQYSSNYFRKKLKLNNKISLK